MSRASAALVILSLCGSALAETQPSAWLDRMNRAFADLTYDGTFSYFGGNDLASLRVVHKVVDGEQRERLVHLNGAPREIVRHGGEVACIVMPGDELLELEGSIPAGPFARAFVRAFDSIDASYRLQLGHQERVAGRTAQRLDIVPKQHDRFSFRLWLDESNAMLLRSELVGLNGQRLEIFQFTHILFGDAVDEAALEADQPDGAMVSHLTLDSTPKPSSQTKVGWRASWLPTGFRMAASDIRRAPSNLHAVHTLVYTDGLAAFSVFVESMPEKGAGAMHRRVGATVTVNRRHTDADGVEHLITLVGELPDATAKRILSEIQPAS